MCWLIIIIKFTADRIKKLNVATTTTTIERLKEIYQLTYENENKVETQIKYVWLVDWINISI